MALISLGTFFCGAKGSANIVQAKTNTTFFPKKMRGTWYQYYNKKISKMTITKNKEVHHYINGTKNIRYLEKSQLLSLRIVKRQKIVSTFLELEKFTVIPGMV